VYVRDVQQASYTNDTDLMKVSPLLPNILINTLSKFIYSYAATSPQLTF